MTVGDAATWFTGVVTLVGLIFAGMQLRLLLRERQDERDAEIRGVALAWRAEKVPTGPSADGTSTSEYQFTVYNPGKLPIIEVMVTLDFPISVTRVHYDGRKDNATTRLTLDAPVLAGGQSRSWKRKLRIRYAEKDGLRGLQANVRFRDLNGNEHHNKWGRSVAVLTSPTA